MSYQILLIDDNPADSRLILEAFKQNSDFDKFEFSFAYDGEEAIRFLNSTINLNNQIGLILLDLNLPRIDGKEVLSFIKSKSFFNSTPVVISSNSDYYKDIDECNVLKADAYVQKPQNFSDLIDFAGSISKSFEESGVVDINKLQCQFEKSRVAI